MTKTQKIWFSIFLAMFLVPEILWSLTSNFLYNIIRFILGLNESKIFYNLLKFPDSSHSKVLLITTLLIQFIGLLGIFLFVLKSKLKTIFKWLILSLLIILIISIVFFLIFVVNVNPSIG